MRIEQFLYGMFEGKIQLFKSPGVNSLLSDKNFQYLRNLGLEDSGHYYWLPTEQVVALPKVMKVSDDNGRDWVVNHTLLIGIHDYLRLTNPAKYLSKFFLSKPNIPETFGAIEVK